MRQLITIGRLGHPSGLQLQGKGIDLRKAGKVSIKRTTEIEWDETYQAWRIRFLSLGRFSNKLLNTGIGWLADQGIQATSILAVAKVSEELILLFDEYFHAVTIEIEVIQSLRRQGLV